MRSALLLHLSRAASAPGSRSTARSLHPVSSLLSRHYAVATPLVEEEAETVVFPREGPGVSYGLNWALAGKGVIVKDKAFHNLEPSELRKSGASIVDNISGLPLHVRGNVAGGTSSEISKGQYGKLLKQVATHISGISNVFVHDGAVGPFPQHDAKVRIISDSASGVLSLKSILWKTTSRAISHDSCPLTVYVASSISPSTGETIGLHSSTSGFAAADVERSSLILCGKAFADATAVKDALSALAVPVIVARGGLPVPARILVSDDSVAVILSLEDTIRSSELRGDFLSSDSGVVLSSNSAAPFFHTGDSAGPNLLKKPASIIFTSADSTGALPLVSKLSPGQAAYHFLAGYQEGKFVPTYSKGPPPVDPLQLAKSLFTMVKESEIPSFLVNLNDNGKRIYGKELVELLKSTLSNNVPQNTPRADSSRIADLKEKYKAFLSGMFHELPEEFTF